MIQYTNVLIRNNLIYCQRISFHDLFIIKFEFLMFKCLNSLTVDSFIDVINNSLRENFWPKKTLLINAKNMLYCVKLKECIILFINLEM